MTNEPFLMVDGNPVKWEAVCQALIEAGYNIPITYQAGEFAPGPDLPRTVNQEYEAFGYTIAHCLKTPLSNIIGYVDYLIELGAETESNESKEILQKIKAAGQHGAHLVDEILLLSGIRRQRVSLRPLDMAEIVSKAIQSLEPKVTQYGGMITVPVNWPVVVGYGPWIQEVWINYLNNGLKYGGRPPKLTLGATPQADSTVRFWVRDNGAGLTPEQQASLFTEFVRLDHSDVAGHGLGLAIVRRIVHNLGGEVGVDCQAGQGCTFYFSLRRVASGSGSAYD